jgi:UDP-2-acetamido-2-deoxy-ribo-hexuluronate aminotransferase
MRIGLNSRLDTIQAAVLIEKLKVFGQEIEWRNRIAARYNEGLRAHVAAVPDVPAGNVSNWAQYTIEHDDRDALAAHLKEQDVPTAVYYPIPLHLQPAYDMYPRGPQGLPVTERLMQRGHQPADARRSRRGDAGPDHRRRRLLQGLRLNP